MAKQDRETQLKLGEKLLGEWGAPGEADFESLTSLLGRDPAADLAVTERLGRIASSESARVLQGLEEKGPDKLVRKEAKRSLYRLEQQGVAPERAPVQPPSLILSAPIEGLLSPIDGRGDQLIWLEKRRGQGSDFLLAVVNDPEGLREANLIHASRKEIHAARQKMWEDNQIRLVPADWRWCDSLIDRAWHSSQARGVPADDYPRLRLHLCPDPVQPAANPVFDHLDVEALRSDSEAVAASALLLAEKEFRTWFLMHDQMQPYIEAFTEIRDSPLVLDPSQRQVRIGELVDRAVVEIFSGELKPIFVRRLQTMSYFLHATQRTPQAALALAVSLALDDSQQGGSGIPFCVELVRASLSAHFQMVEEQDQDASRSSLVLTPGQAIREGEARKGYD